MPSPTFPMSSCLTGGGHGYRFDLDIAANYPRSSQSSPSSTLSESSNSTPLFISTKRNRAPRKRPNQCSSEAAALLSTIYPKLFSATNIRRSTFHIQQPTDDPFPVLLPSLPLSGDASLPLHKVSSPVKSPIQPRPWKTHNTEIHSAADFQFQDPGSPEFDAESILDEEVEEGIDSIMGNLSMSNESNVDCLNNLSNSIINPYLAGLMGFGICGSFGHRFGISSNIRGALKQSNDGEWWSSPTVAVKDIVPTLNAPPGKAATAEKKKKKKLKKKVDKEEDMERNVNSAVSLPEDGILKPQLGLKLNYDAVRNEWSGGSPFSGLTGSTESAAEIIVNLADIDLFFDVGGGAMREASVQRYKEKRRNRLFSKKIRYEVRKVNADQRPRMKGRFVRALSLTQ